MNPNNCALPIEIFPFTSSLRLNFAESLEIFSMTLFSWSFIVTSSIMMRLRRPMSIRLMLTPVLSCLPNSLATATESLCWMYGIFSKEMAPTYKQMIIASTVRIILLNLLIGNYIILSCKNTKIVF